MAKRPRHFLLLIGLALAGTAAAGAAAAAGSDASVAAATALRRRTLLASSAGSPYPPAVPAPFARPRDVVDATHAAVKAGTLPAFAAGACKALGNPAAQGTREFRDPSIQLFFMATNIFRAVYVSDIAKPWGEIMRVCQASPDKLQAEGLGHAVALAYAEGIMESYGATAALEAAYDAAGGCAGVAGVLDVAAAVIKSRGAQHGGSGELKRAIATYSPRLAACTPADVELRFVPSRLGSAGSAASKAAPAAKATGVVAAGGGGKPAGAGGSVAAEAGAKVVKAAARP